MKAVISLMLTLGFSAALPAQALLPDFLKAKSEFHEKRYAESMATLDRIDQRLPEASAGDRERIAPALAFYRAANAAMLGDKTRALAFFEKFLALSPNASIDPAAYDKPVLAAFQEARSKLHPGETAPADGGESGIAADYRSFPFTGTEEAGPRGDYATGPLSWIMTSREKAEWKSLATDPERGTFLADFWRRRDRSPETPRNELREEIDRRIAFADARFRQGETRGSMTDRGEVFILLGPPSYIGRRPLSSQDDPSVGQQARDIEPLPPGASSGRVLAHNLEIDTNSKFSYGEAENYRETWHYRELPPGFPARSLDSDFVTKKGFGDHQLSRDARTLEVLSAARERLQPGG